MDRSNDSLEQDDRLPTSGTRARTGAFSPASAATVEAEKTSANKTGGFIPVQSLPAQPVLREVTTGPYSSRKIILQVFLRIFRYLTWAAAAWVAIVVCLVMIFRFVDPPASALMLQQRLSGDEVAQQWVALDDISPNVIRSVLVSEDGRFCQHWGVDYQELQNAIEQSNDGIARGASTISMQVTKNMFLWQSKSYLRKAIEIPLTYVIEAVWNKRRIMEVYLNIAEWGPGIFGVEAASQFHFGKSAKRLSEREAARLAVTLPNPYARDAGDPGPGTRRLAAEIQERAQSVTRSQVACVAAAIRP